jgi:hypothetical protein
MRASKEVSDVICACEALLATLESISDLSQRIEKEAILYQLHYYTPCSEASTNSMGGYQEFDHGN